MSKTNVSHVEEKHTITNEMSEGARVVGYAVRESESEYRIKLSLQPLSRFYMVPDRKLRGMYVLFAGKRERGDGRPPAYFGRIGWAIRVQGHECLEMYFPDIRTSYFMWLQPKADSAAEVRAA